MATVHVCRRLAPSLGRLAAGDWDQLVVGWRLVVVVVVLRSLFGAAPVVVDDEQRGRTLKGHGRLREMVGVIVRALLLLLH